MMNRLISRLSHKTFIVKSFPTRFFSISEKYPDITFDLMVFKLTYEKDVLKKEIGFKEVSTFIVERL